MRIAFALLFATGMVAAAASPESRTWRFRGGAAPRVRVDEVAGSISVAPGKGDEVVVESRNANPGEWTVEVTQDSDGVKARACCGPCGSKDQHCQGGGHVDFVLQVPPAARLSLSSVSAGIEVRGVTGEQRLNTVSGAIKSDGQQVRLGTVSGAVQWSGACGADCRVDASSVSGAIELALDARSSFGLSFSSVSGRFQDDLGTEVDRSRGQVQGRYGRGEGSIHANTVSGRLSLRKR